MKLLLLLPLLLSGVALSAEDPGITGSCISSVRDLTKMPKGKRKIGRFLWKYSGPCGFDDPFYFNEDRELVTQKAWMTNPMDVDMGPGVSCFYSVNEELTEIIHSCYSDKLDTFPDNGVWDIKNYQ